MKDHPTPAENSIPQIPAMSKLIDNIHSRVRDDLEETITKKSKLRIAAPTNDTETPSSLRSLQTHV